MRVTVRSVIGDRAAIVACAIAQAADPAASYPQRPIRMIVLFPPGGSRHRGAHVRRRAAERLGQPW